MNYDIDKRGILLEGLIHVDDLFKLNPQFFSEYCKGVVNLDSERVVVGMQVHRSGLAISGDPADNSFGFNVFRDGSVVYESSLNVPFNVAHGTTAEDMRVITDAGLIGRINTILADRIGGLSL